MYLVSTSCMCTGIDGRQTMIIYSAQQKNIHIYDLVKDRIVYEEFIAIIHSLFYIEYLLRC